MLSDPHTSHYDYPLRRGQSNYHTFPQSIASDALFASVADDRQREDRDDVDFSAAAVAPPPLPHPAHMLIKAVFIVALTSIVSGIAFVYAHDILVSWLISTGCSVLLAVCSLWTFVLFRLAHLFAHRHDAPRRGDCRTSQAINEDGFLQRLHASTLTAIRSRKQSFKALLCLARLLTFALIALQPFIIYIGARALYFHHGTHAHKEHRHMHVESRQMRQNAQLLYLTTTTRNDVSFRTDLAIFLLLLLPLLLQVLLMLVLLDIRKMTRYLQWDLCMQEKRTSVLIENDDAPLTRTPSRFNECVGSQLESEHEASPASLTSSSSDSFTGQVYTELNDHDFFHSTNTLSESGQLRRSCSDGASVGHINGEGAVHFPAINDSPFLNALNHHHRQEQQQQQQQQSVTLTAMSTMTV